MINNSTITIVKKNGNIDIDVFSILVLPMEQPTNRTDPTGGVHKPIAKENINTIPKCVADMP